MVVAHAGRRSGMRSRRGATLVLVALVLVVVVGMVGVVVDFSRFYTYRTQMQTTADAAALAGATEVAHKTPAVAPDTALHYVQHDSVDGGVASVPRAAIQPVIWNFASGSATIAGSWTAAGVNAVKVTATHAAPYTFGTVFTANPTLTLTTTAIAAVQSVGTTDCLKPWTVSYQTLLNVLYPPAGSKPVGYNLTAADITRLSQMGSANQIPLLAGNTNPLAPGNIGSVQVSTPWDGNNSYKTAISGSCPNKFIGPGTVLSTDPGQGAGRTAKSLQDFCNANGGTSGSQNSFTCLASPKVKLAVWDSNNGGTGSNLTFHVKYVAVFAIVSFQKGGTEQITGYFSTMATTGTPTSSPSPASIPILVQ